jgi:hypothetical protein
MADAPAPATVSPSRLPGNETPRQPPFRRDDSETSGKTPGLKALARLVIARDARRDAERDSLSRAAPQTDRAPETVSTGETAASTWGEAEDERAAIVEHDGAIPREWAEGLVRLDPDRPPGDVPLRRWQRFVDDVGRFLDSPFYAVAASLGWGPHDLFGSDRDRPFTQIEQSGLLWQLNGNRLVMLAEDTVRIETPAGTRLTYRREPIEPGCVLAWELAR